MYPINLPASGEIPLDPSEKDDHPFFREGTSSFVAPIMQAQSSPMARAQSASVCHLPMGGVKPERHGEEERQQTERQ